MGIAEHVVNEIVPAIIASPAKTRRRSIKVTSLSAFDERPWADRNLVNTDNRYAEIICHCERVTLGEIEEVMQSALPPRTIKALRRRTRAMFGRCQGFYCGARVLQAFQASGDAKRSS
jgi:glycerol-3-phosphate dehydrogenase